MTLPPELNQLADDLDKRDRVSSGKVNLDLASKTDPDRYAEARNVAGRTSLPVDTVERNLDEVKRSERVNNAPLDDAPVLTEFLQNFDNSRLSVDDVDNLHQTEQSAQKFKRLKNSLANAGNEANKYTGDLIETIGVYGQALLSATTASDPRQPEYDEGSSEPGQAVGPTKLRVIGDYISEVEQYDYVPEFTFDRFLDDPSVSNFFGYLGEQGPAGATSILPVMASSPAFFMSLNQRYAEEIAEKQGKDRTDVELGDLVRAAPTTAVVGTIEKLATKFLFTRTGGKPGRQILEKTKTEYATEYAQGLGEYIGTNITAGTPLSDEAALTQALGEGLIGSGIGGVAGTGTATVDAVAARQDKKKRAALDHLNKSLGSQVEQSHLDEVTTLAQSSLTNKRAADAYAQFVDGLGPDQEVVISSEAVDTLVNEGVTLPEYITEQHTGGLGQDVKIKMSQFATDIAPRDDLMEVVRPHIKLSEESLTQNELSGSLDTLQKTLARQMKQAAVTREVQDESDRIFKQVQEELVATGRMNQTAAQHSAAIIPAVVSTGVQRLRDRGVEISPAEFYKQYLGFKVVGPDAPADTGDATIVDQSVVELESEGDVGKVATGQPVTFNYSRNLESATEMFGIPDKDSPFGRGFEPAGRYMTVTSGNREPDNRFEQGRLTFQNPLVVPNDNSQWKQTLSEQYGGVTGKELSKALIADGYDGVITTEGDRYISEVVDFTTFDEAKALYQGGGRDTVINAAERFMDKQNDELYRKAMFVFNWDMTDKLPPTDTGDSLQETWLNYIQDDDVMAEADAAGETLAELRDRYVNDIQQAIDDAGGANLNADDLVRFVGAFSGRFDQFLDAASDMPSEMAFAARQLVNQQRQQSDQTKPGTGDQDITDTLAFKRWFGDSKVVDENGDPLTMYHGTGADDIESFDIGRSGSVQYSDWGPGIYFTPSENIADEYRKDALKETDEESNRVFEQMEEIERNVKTVNGAPQYPDEYYDLLDQFRTLRRQAGESGQGQVVPAYLSIQNPMVLEYQSTANPGVGDEARARGHDGIIVQNPNGSINEVVAFRPEQIKSATGNQGTFDPQDPNILNQSDRAEVTDQVVNLFTAIASQPDEQGFQVPTSTATNIDELVQDVFGAGTVTVTKGKGRGGDNVYSIHQSRTDALGEYDMHVMDIHYEGNPETDGKPFIRIFPGEGFQGSSLYQVGFMWARNNGKTMVPDPAGITRINRLRRNEAMISSALRFGTTSHLEPHHHQFVGLLDDTDYKRLTDEPGGMSVTPPADIEQKLIDIKKQHWIDESSLTDPSTTTKVYKKNLRTLMDASTALVERRFPDLEKVEFTTDGEFLYDGKTLPENIGDPSGETGVGSSTLRRAAVVQSVRREAPGLLGRIAAGSAKRSTSPSAVPNQFGMAPDSDPWRDLGRIIADSGLEATDNILYQSDEAQDLFVQHNLSVENYLAAKELGGLAAPSLAISRTTAGGMENFGEITLIADKRMLMSDKAQVFASDVYSPRQPRAVYDINTKSWNAFMDRIADATEVFRPPNLNEVKSHGTEQLRRNDAVRYHYLQTIGKAPKPKKQKVDPTIKRAAKLDHDSVWSLMDDPAFMKIANQHFDRMKQAREEAGKSGDFYYDENGQVNENILRDFAHRVINYKDSGGIDTYETGKAVRKKFDTKSVMEGFDQFVDQEFKNLDPKAKLFKGFTYSGNRRYAPYNMVNVVREMTREIRSGEGFMYGAGNIRSAVTPRLKTIQAIKDRRDQIVSAETMEEIKEDSSQRLQQLLDDLQPFYRFDGESFMYMDDAAEAITEYGKGRRSALNEAFDLPPEMKQEVDNYLNYLMHLPTDYFEVKVGRPVLFNEFEVAVVPKGTRKDVVKKLRMVDGLTVRYYDPSVSGDRTRVIESLNAQLFFQSTGLYNGIERAVMDMKLPAWDKKHKETWTEQDREQLDHLLQELHHNMGDRDVLGPQIVKLREKRKRSQQEMPKARGADVWAKLRKMSLKKEEIEWTGVQEYLTADPDARFTREQVMEFANQNGVQVEVVTTEADPDADMEPTFDWQEEVVDDYDEYVHIIDDMVDNPDQFEAWMTEWIDDESNHERIVSFYKDEMGITVDPDNVIDSLAEQGLNPIEDMKPAVDNQWMGYAEDVAREEYMENPVMRYTDNETGYAIIGNDDSGYDVHLPNGNFEAMDAFSFSEAEVQATEIARERGDLDDTSDARWEEFVMEGDYDNYREMKLTLPKIQGDYYNSTHFDDRNIVAFLRVDDRELSDGVEQTTNTYFIDEFQSDWHQEGRQKGYLDLPPGTDVWALIAEANALQQELDAETQAELRRATGEFDPFTPSVLNPDLLVVNRRVAALAEQHPVINEIARVNNNILKSRNGKLVPDAPFKGDAWINLGLKTAIVDAVNNGYTSIAWPNSTVMSDRWSDKYQELYSNQYDRKMVKFVKKLTGIEPRELDMDGDPVEKLSGLTVTSEFDNEANMDVYIIRDSDGEALPGEVHFALYRAEERIEQLQMAPKGYHIIPITDELRNKVKEDGFSLFQAEDTKPTRASLTIADDQMIVRLGESSDLTSFLHEAGHMFLEMERRIAADHGLSEDQRTILNFLDIGSFDQVTREHHEKWAETFEVYLMEGKAPSVALRKAFQSFKQWMTRFYRALRNDPRLARADLSPEITGVFDRMLATDEEIDYVKNDPQYQELFRSKEQAGMTDEEWGRYQKTIAKRDGKARESLQEKALKAYREQKKKWWKSEKAPLIDEHTERLRQQPVYAIMEDAREWPMDYHALKEIIGYEKQPGKLIGRTKTDGIDPGEYAELYGYESVQAMFDDIMKNPPIKEAAEAAAQADMIEKHGDILYDGTIEEEARAMMHNEEQADLLLQEIKALKKDSKATPINRDNLKESARQMIASMRYREITPSKYYRAEIKAARAASTAKDDKAQLRAKIQQLVNHYLYTEAVRVKQQMETHRRYVRGVQNRTYSTKQVHPEYVANMKAIAGMYDLRQKPAEQIKTVSDVLEWYEAQVSDPNQFVKVELLDPILVRALAAKKDQQLKSVRLPSFDDLTAEDLEGLVGQLKHLRHVGGRLSDEVKAEFQHRVEELSSSIVEKGGKDRRRTAGVPALGDRQRRDFSHAVNKLPSLRNLVRKMDNAFSGREDGPAYDMIYRVIEDANSKKIKVAREVYDRFNEELDDMHTLGLSRRDYKTYTLDSGLALTLHSESRFMMALYWGTETSREAIRDGHGVNDRDVNRIFKDLTADQLKMLNKIWRVNESVWPQLSAASVAQYGVAPPKLDPTPFTVNGVELTGGHMRLFYDSTELEMRSEADEAGRLATIMPTKAGSLHARVGSGGRPVRLDKNNIARALDDNVHFIAFAEAGDRIASLINAKEVRAAIERKHGEGFYRALIENLESLSANRTHREAIAWLASVSRLLRRAATMKHLAYSIRNTVQQVSALPIAMEEVGSLPFVKAAARFASPATGPDTIEFVKSRSEFMTDRASLVNREAAEYLRKIQASGRAHRMWDQFARFGFTPQTIVDATLAYPTWLAKYEQAMERHGDDKKAASEADTAVAESVGSGSDLHLGGAFHSTQSELTRTLTVFGSWFNAYHQRIYKASGGYTEVNADTVKALITMPIIAGTIAAALVMDFPEDDEDWVEWALKRGGGFVVGTVPLLRDVVSSFSGFSPKTLLSGGSETPYRFVSEIQAFQEERQSGLKTTADVGKAVTTLVPVPGSGNVLRVMDFVDSNRQGKETGSTPKKIYQSLVEGPDRNK